MTLDSNGYYSRVVKLITAFQGAGSSFKSVLLLACEYFPVYPKD